ncbi:hypothetical protein [Deinococcus enclensis]|uniref:Uncharacterized protein n=1 Tax=Deinococcus enclensis TaxID=1049582 RepID=A0ABT9MCL4_9DEIO|nr:hypothetical protein [Deinococcus enclensis]MDP9764244.1 hypothetical protein [Deinococcus enclensis]
MFDEMGHVLLSPIFILESLWQAKKFAARRFARPLARLILVSLFVLAASMVLPHPWHHHVRTGLIGLIVLVTTLHFTVYMWRFMRQGGENGYYGTYAYRQK